MLDPARLNDRQVLSTSCHPPGTENGRATRRARSKIEIL